MSWLNDATWSLLAQGGGGQGSPMDGLLGFMLPLVGVIVLYILLIQRPQQRDQRARRTMLTNLKKNDHVLTTSGIYGVVTNVRADADEVTIRVDDSSNTRLRMTLTAVGKVLSSEGVPAQESKDSKNS